MEEEGGEEKGRERGGRRENARGAAGVVSELVS